MSFKIIIGTASLSGNYGSVPKQEIIDTLNYCYENNFREFDTAPNYGQGVMESYLGDIFLKRDDIKIHTKIGNLINGGKDFSIDSLRKSFIHSLKRLKKENIDTLFLHNPREEINDYDEIEKFLNQLIDEGCIRKKGISLARGYNYDDSIIKKFDSIQDDYNLLHLQLPNYLTSKQNFIIRSPFATGLLSGKVNSDTKFTDPYRSAWLKDERLSSLIKRIRKIESVSATPLAEIALRYVLFQKGIDKIIIGVKKKDHVDHIIHCIEKGPLDVNLKNKLQEMYDDDFGLVNENHLRY
jgi:aryl-alcohol dehydrogenase-like predicted oxidoreductase|tara:strand:- start:4328 stop:5215 length:888 start_codon:yes stop_codon:yes gene_type:complete